MTCSPSDVVCAIEQLTRAVRAATTTGPTALEWWAFAVSSLGVLASTVVGVVAWRTSLRAVAIADGQRQASLDAALDDALGRFLEAAGTYIADVERWREEISSHRYRQRFHIGDAAGRRDAPLAPSPRPLTAVLLSARLRARGGDGEMLTLIAEWLTEIRRMVPVEQLAPLNELISDLTRWRAGELPQDRALPLVRSGIARTRAARESVDVKVDVPDTPPGG